MRSVWCPPLLCLAALVLFSCGNGVGCRGCDRGDRVAELISQRKQVLRDRAGHREEWKPAFTGDTFQMGDGLKTGIGAFARLKLIPEGQIHVQSETVIRFQAVAPGQQGQQVQVETGSIEIESGTIDLQIHTAEGLALLQSGSRVRVSSDGQSQQLQVLVGSVQVDKEGKRVSVSAGNTLSLQIGDLSIDEAPQPDSGARAREAVVAPAQPDGGVRDAAQVSADEEVPSEEVPSERVRYRATGSVATYAHLTIAAGESATIHDPHPPTNVRILFSGCEGGGLLEVGRGNRGYAHATVRADADATIRLSAGAYRYRLRCLSGRRPVRPAAAQGRLRIHRDAAKRRLPSKPPSVRVEADGRKYTVRYQNRLPELTFLWPDPPLSGPYELELTLAGGGQRTERSSTPRVVLPSGSLPEGTHDFVFSTTGGFRSPASVLRIAFDNLARTAYLSDPIDGEAAPGQKILVAGAALANAGVSVAGTPVETDSQGRFRTEVLAPERDRTIAVRVQRGGQVHYYLRHLRTGP